MTRWWAAAGLAGVVLLALLVLSHLSRRALTEEPRPSHGSPASEGAGPAPDGPDDTRADHGPEWVPESVAPTEASRRRLAARNRDARNRAARNGGWRLSNPEFVPVLPPDGSPDAGDAAAPAASMSPWMLLANVALTQGLFTAVLAGGLVLFAVPPSALGLVPTTAPDLVLGVALGLGLYAANEVGAAVADRAGIGHDEHLRELLAPDSAVGWAVLLLLVLPVIAGFEELLFRGVLVGVLAAGFPVSPWLLVALSSVAFGIGHGAQGRAGVLVTGTLGLVLGAAFVLTGSLVAVVVAHYLVNALEFVVHEGLGLEWTVAAGR